MNWRLWQESMTFIQYCVQKACYSSSSNWHILSSYLLCQLWSHWLIPCWIWISSISKCSRAPWMQFLSLSPATAGSKWTARWAWLSALHRSHHHDRRIMYLPSHMCRDDEFSRHPVWRSAHFTWTVRDHSITVRSVIAPRGYGPYRTLTSNLVINYQNNIFIQATQARWNICGCVLMTSAILVPCRSTCQ